MYTSASSAPIATATSTPTPRVNPETEYLPIIDAFGTGIAKTIELDKPGVSSLAPNGPCGKSLSARAEAGRFYDMQDNIVGSWHTLMDKNGQISGNFFFCMVHMSRGHVVVEMGRIDVTLSLAQAKIRESFPLGAAALVAAVPAP